ncbi:MAG: hypothetical protein L3J06_06080, partial [Cyclobacteriaceae bacterium]|nr:hypothetical protein [Cyclobacteriaceae bacterium]
MTSLFLTAFQVYNASAQCPTNGATNITVTDVSCNGLSDGSILYEFTDGTSPYNNGDWIYTMYELPSFQVVTPPFGSAVVSFPSTTEVLVSGLAANNYLLLVDHIPSGCSVQILSAVGGTPLTEPAVLDFTGTSTTPDCDNLGSGTITVQANGGTAPYTVNYVSGTTNFGSGIIATDGGTVVFNSITADTYEAQIVDANNCTLNKNDIIVAFGPNAGVDGSHTYCFSGSSSNLFDDLGGSPDSGGAWTGPSVLAGGSLGTFDPSINSAGIYTYTVSVAGCADSQSIVTVTIDAAPNTALAVSSAANPICEGSSTTIEVALSENGYSYQLRNDAGDVNIGAPVVGNGGTINLPTGALLATTTFNVLVTNGTCSAELTTLVTVNVDSAPNTGLTVTAASDPICEGDNTTIDVALSENGYSYQLRNDAGDVNIGAPVVGNGGTINLPTGALLATTTFNVLVTNGTCSAELTTLVTVNVDSAPNTGLTVTAASDPICEGDNTSIDVALSENGYSYQLRNDAGDVNIGAPVVGNGGTINLPTGALLATTTFNVLVTNGTCSAELTTLVTVNVTASPNTGLTVTAATDPICEGDNTTIDVALSENGYSYQLRNDAGDVNIGAPVVGNGATINLPTGALLATTTFNVLVTNGTCSTELTTLVTVNVTASPNTGLTVTAATGPICEGDNTTIDVSLSENGYSYQLRNDAGDVNVGAPVVGNGGTINLPTGALLATTTFNVLVSNGVCTPIELTTLVTVNVTASPNTGLTVTAAT